jgi:hypothetical protein
VLRFLRNDRGQSIIELALAAPILVMALLGGIDLMRVAAAQQAVQNAARAGADVIGQDSAAAQSRVLSAISGELSGTPGLHTATSIQVCTVVSPPSPSPCVQLPARDATNVFYTGTFADGSGPCVSSSSGICYVRVRVIYEFHTIIPWWFVPNVIIVDRGTSMPLLS